MYELRELARHGQASAELQVACEAEPEVIWRLIALIFAIIRPFVIFVVVIVGGNVYGGTGNLERDFDDFNTYVYGSAYNGAHTAA